MRLLAVFLGALVLTSFSPVFAQTDTGEFNVRQTIIGTDSTPPTTPTLLSIDPLSANQIDLAWTASTDDFTLWGYVVFRDSAPIATTTLTSFADTGLVASTTYSYFVQAFDAASNYSASSNSLSTTTLEAPLVPVATSTSPSQGTAARVVAEDVVVTPDTQSARFDIETSLPARFEIRWGRTSDFELGYITSDILRRDYSTIVTDLEPGTKYEYQIIGYTPYGKGNVVETGHFRTLNDIDLTAPANVKRFTATPDGVDVRLSWELPADEDFSYVRIVRSHLGYPINPNDGAIVFQGVRNIAVDSGVLLNYSPAYYTAFVYDRSGNISSGAIAIAYAENSSDVSTDVGVTNPIDGGSDVVDFGLGELASTTQKMPDAFDILIKQANQEFSFESTKIILNSREPFLLQLDAQTVTSNLKSVIVTLQDPTNNRQTFSFLLRLNKDQTAYEAIIAPLGVEGESVMILNIYDFRTLRVAEYRTRLFFENSNEELTAEDLRENDTKLLWQFSLSILLFAGLLIWWLIAKRRDEDKEDDLDKEKRYSTVS